MLRTAAKFATSLSSRSVTAQLHPVFKRVKLPNQLENVNTNRTFLNYSIRAFSTTKTSESNEEDAINATEELEAIRDEEAVKRGVAPEITIPESHEKVTGEAQSHSFQTETQKILHIVAQSLYTEREVFVRELVSNASDAMEKVRHLQVTGAPLEEKDKPLEVRIYTDDKAGILIIQDAGIGMTKEELVQNLGKIGHSGSLEFLKKLGENPEKASIIGQFGVGFYSTFMVGSNIKVYTRAAHPGAKGYLWESDGSGTYSIAEADGVERGTKIVITLKDSAHEFSNKRTIESVIKKYSNFVGFPILVNNDRVNTVRALWTLPKNSITEEEHKEFYQFIARAYDSPIYKLHYATDSPLNIRGLFYFPGQQMEKYGMGRFEPGVSLFSRKVLIQAKAKGLLPEWLRFVKGVVDSEDIPLNISREHMQDSSLIQKLNSVLTKRILKFLEEQSKKDPDTYIKWYQEFGSFLKEAAVSDNKWKEDVAKLLRFETSALESGKTTSLNEYVSRMKPEQKEIYFLTVPGRSFAETSPYYEGPKAKGYEVLFVYTHIDDFALANLTEFALKKVVNAELANIEAGTDSPSSEGDLTKVQIDELCNYIRETLADRVTVVRETKRVLSVPALVVDHESATSRRMMRMVDPSKVPPLPKQQLEINVKHPILKKLYSQKGVHPKLAKEVIEQMFDNALVAAGLFDDPRAMLQRLNKILEKALDSDGDLSEDNQSEATKKDEIN